MDSVIEKCTSEKNTQDNWDLILEICEKYASKEPKACVKTICKRIFHKNPNVSIRAITLLDACSQNCGKNFNRELSSKDFSQSIKKSFSSLQRIPSLQLIKVFKKWANEFKNDSELALAASLYDWVKNEYVDLVKQAMDEKQMAEHGPSRRLVSQLQAKEEEDLAQAIALSLKDTSSSVSSNLNPRPISSSNEISSLYPRSQLLFDSTSSFLTSSNTSKPVNHPSKGYVRAVYDFEAAEDNELTFKAGDIILLLDDSDENWWLGSCNNNKGLFPAQFVKREKDMDETKILQSNFNEVNQKTNVKNELNNIKIIPKLDERKIDECLRLITTVDPTGEFCQDPPELRQLEAECLAMLPLVDPELKSVDKKLIMLTELNQRLLDAFQLYHNIMSHQNAATAYYAGVSNANLMKSYLPNSVNVFPYSQPISMPGVYVPSNLPTIPANGSNVPAESNGSMMVPPSDTYSVQSGIYANPQTDNCSGNILQNVQAHAVPQFTLQPFYGPNQAVSDVTQQMQSYPSVSNHYGISTYSITEPKVNVYPDQQSMHTPQ